MKRAFSILIFQLIAYTLCSQQDAQFSAKHCQINSINETIVIDGKLNEASWSSLEILSDFMVQSPVDGVPATKKTEVQIGYDEQSIFVAARIYDDKDHIVNSLKRDNYSQDDEFGVLFDPVNQKTNGFGFGVNTAGAMSEVVLSQDGADDTWDNRWKVAVKQYEDHWVAELQIPFKTLRYDANKTVWGVNFIRTDPGTNEAHVWSPVPRQFSYLDLGYFGTMEFLAPPEKQGGNIALIPYVSVSSSKSYEPFTPSNKNFNIGGDAKVAISSGLNLDLTINPDFSQVEVDQQVTNLDRFSVFFPEKRQFFIENSDIFSAYGQFANQPFYSRRIGLGADASPVPILFGARLSGNVNKSLRIGTFSMQTKAPDMGPSENFSAGVFQQSFGARSNVKGIILNRQGFDGFEAIKGDYGRNAGGEINLINKSGKLQGKMGYIHSFKQGITNNNNHIYGRFDYSGQKFRTFLFIQNIGDNYFADMGFNARVQNFDPISSSVVRIGYTQVGNMLDYYIYPDSEKVNYHWSGLENFVIVNNGGLLNEWYTRLRHFIFYQNTSELRFRINHIYRDLVFPFALAENPLPAKQYDDLEFNIQYKTDRRKKVNAEIFAVYGEFYDGRKLTYIGDLNIRWQPRAKLTLSLEQNIIKLTELYGDLTITSANVNFEYNFSTSLFFSTFLQYNTQLDNFNVNTRLQWRYAPMSDVFLVYTDNYLIDDFIGPRNRSFVIKANYWLSI